MSHYINTVIRPVALRVAHQAFKGGVDSAAWNAAVEEIIDGEEAEAVLDEALCRTGVLTSTQTRDLLVQWLHETAGEIQEERRARRAAADLEDPDCFYDPRDPW